MLRPPRRKGRLQRLEHVILGFASVAILIAGIGAVWLSSLKIPDLSSFDTRKIAESTKIYDRTGEILLYDIHANARRTVIPFEEISEYIKHATIAIEDAEFYEHHGIKPTSIIRALLVNIKSGEYTQGGSTITQQVVKNSLLTPKKTITRKLKEWVLAIKLERSISKDQILNLYLNEISYGGSLYGVEEASRAYFGKSAKDVTLAEASYLAALPQAPSRYSPYGENREKLEARKNLVLVRMKEEGFITDEEFSTAQVEKVSFIPREDRGIKAAHFVFYIREYLEEKYGVDMVESGGLTVTTTLDFEMQQKAEEIIAATAERNTEQFNATNAALVAIDPKSGQILSMVGSRNYFDEEIDGNFNVATAKRQPGSTFKPIVYATAFNMGYTTDTVLFDVPIQFNSSCAATKLVTDDECYSPGNYDDIFRGPMTLRDALAQSINVPAVELLYLTGLDAALQTAETLGIKSLGNDPSRFGLSLVLGGGEVSLLELTSAYGVFANDGIRNPASSILEVKAADGTILESFTEQATRAIPEQTARMINDILSDDIARRPSYGVGSPLNIPGRQAAVKTGTTNDYRDTWVVGYTPDVVVGVWAGNNDNTSIEKKVAGLVIAPTWNEFMRAVMPKYEPSSFPAPEPTDPSVKPVLRGIWTGGETYFVDTRTNDRATESTPFEYRKEVVETDVHSILHWVDKRNPLGPNPTNPARDSQYANWEYAIRNSKWRNGGVNFTPKIGSSDIRNNPEPTKSISISISAPSTRKEYDTDEIIPVRHEIQSINPITKVEMYINGEKVSTSNVSPFYFAFIPEEIDDIDDRNELKVIVYDNQNNTAEDTITFRVDN